MIYKSVQNVWQPPPMLTVSQWADECRRLSSEASAEPGAWRTDRAPYQRGMMDALSDRDIHTVVIMSSSQVGKSEVILNIMGYYIQQDPAPMLALQPTLEMAEAFSKDRIAPMIRDTKTLTALIADAKSRDSGNTLLQKKFPGGHLTLAGANSPASLASRPVRIILADEVDRYPSSAGTEGDPVLLAIARTKTFWNRKIVLTSTPTIDGFSRIQKAWEGSDMRRYYVPCPECGESQYFQWEQLQWEEINPTAVVYVCKECGGIIPETKKSDMIRNGAWRGETPCNGIAGFHLNELYSPWRSWGEIVMDYLRTKNDRDQHKTWVNTALGEPFREDEAETPDLAALKDRMEGYAPQVPLQAGIMTAGVDVQANRIEVEVVAWGVGGESWGIEYAVLYGDTRLVEVWNQLDSFLLRKWTHESGEQIGITRTYIDSGYIPSHVARYVVGKKNRGIYAVKGSSNETAPEVHGPVRQRHGAFKIEVYNLGVNRLKTQMFAWFGKQEPGPGYCHIPDTYPPEWFDMLQSEQLCIQKKTKVGTAPVSVWVKKNNASRNEAIDLRVYALAALMSMRVDVKAHIAAFKAAAEEKLKPATQTRSYQPARRSFVGGWR